MKGFTLLILVSTTACLVLRGEARRRLDTFDGFAYKTYTHEYGEYVDSIRFQDMSYCCPKGTRRAQNLHALRQREDFDFFRDCPCISETVEEGKEGWTFLKWTNEDDWIFLRLSGRGVPEICGEAVSAREVDQERQLANYNHAICKANGGCIRGMPSEYCTETVLECIETIAKEPTLCPLQSKTDLKDMENWAVEQPICQRAQAEVERVKRNMQSAVTIAHANTVLCEAGGCHPDMPEEYCTQTMLGCFETVAESLCPLESMADMQAVHESFKTDPVCIQAQAEQRRAAKHRRHLGLRRHGVPAWML